MKTNPTVVVSIRIPKALVPKVDERAKREKKARSRFVEDVFEAAFRKMERPARSGEASKREIKTHAVLKSPLLDCHS